MARKNKSAETHVLFDIGSASVGACVGMVANGAVEVLWSARKEYAQEETQVYDDYSERMEAALYSLSEELTHTGMRIASRNPHCSNTVHTAHAVLSSPWSIGHTTIVEKVYAGNTNITQHTLDELAHDAHEESMRNDYVHEWVALGEHISPVELTLSYTCVDGYAYNLQARSFPAVHGSELTLAVHTAIAPTARLDAIRGVLRHHAPHGEHLVHSRSGVLARSFVEEFSALIAEHASLGVVIVGEHTTELLGLRAGAVVAEHVVPYGMYHLLRATAPQHGTEATPARTDVWWSTLATYATHDEQYVLEHAPEHFARGMLHWHKALCGGMHALWGSAVPATTVLLYADARIAPYCIAAFQDVDEKDVPERYVAQHVPYRAQKNDQKNDTGKHEADTARHKGLSGTHDARMCYTLRCIARGA
jgi:hypothetical protein